MEKSTTLFTVWMTFSCRFLKIKSKWKSIEFMRAMRWERANTQQTTFNERERSAIQVREKGILDAQMSQNSEPGCWVDSPNFSYLASSFLIFSWGTIPPGKPWVNPVAFVGRLMNRWRFTRSRMERDEGTRHSKLHALDFFHQLCYFFKAFYP